MRYTGDLGCRHRGVPHQMRIIHENPQVKWELCMICGKRFRWNKGYKGRTNNIEYVKVHIRSFCQKFGATKRIYYKTYRPKECIIII